MASLSPNVDTSKIPFARNPNGDPPNFLDPPSLAPAIFIVGLTLTIISGPLIILRLATNLKTVGKWGLDDCISIPIYQEKILVFKSAKELFQAYVSLQKSGSLLTGQ